MIGLIFEKSFRLFILDMFSKNKSGRRDSNPLPTAWEAVALPGELLPLIIIDRKIKIYFQFNTEDVLK